MKHEGNRATRLTTLRYACFVVLAGVLIPGCGIIGPGTQPWNPVFSTSASPDCGCQTSQTTTGGGAVKDLGAADAYQMAQSRAGDPSLVVLDVRTAAEFAGGRVANAVNLDINDATFRDQAGQLDRTKAYLVYCGSGSRSSKAAAILIELGFFQVYNLLDGLTAWRAQGYPITP